MHLLKLIFFTLAELIRQLVNLPKTISSSLRKKREQTEQLTSESERLDRIRNPSKYQGR